jgi:hypothetical protein
MAMISIHAHFDGNVIVPHEPVDLPRDRDLIVRIEPARSPEAQPESALEWLADNAVYSSTTPDDLAHRHDHYFCGSPKRED